MSNYAKYIKFTKLTTSTVLILMFIFYLIIRCVLYFSLILNFLTNIDPPPKQLNHKTVYNMYFANKTIP